MIRKKLDSALNDGPFSYTDYGFNAYNFIVQNNELFNVLTSFLKDYRNEILELFKDTYTDLVCEDFLETFNISEDGLIHMFELYASDWLVETAIFDCLHNRNYDLKVNIINLITPNDLLNQNRHYIFEDIICKIVENKFNGNLLIKKVEDKKVKFDI